MRRVGTRGRVLLVGLPLEAGCLWLIARALRGGDILVEVRRETEVGGIVTHEYVRRSLATPLLYWGSIAGLALVALAIAYFIIWALRSRR
jgi:hypothetical protein